MQQTIKIVETMFCHKKKTSLRNHIKDKIERKKKIFSLLSQEIEIFSIAGAEGGVPLLRQPRRRLRGADEVDRSWVGEFRASITVGAAEPGGPDRVLPRASRAGLGLAAPGGVFLEERRSERIEKRLSCFSNFLSQAGRLELVNSVFSTLPTFFMCTLKIPKTIIKQIDIFRKHCLWRGNDISSRKPPLIAWALVTRRKVNGGLEVLRLDTQNDALLLKFLHKFFNSYDLPWVNLIWNKYYSSRGLPGHRTIGSFWWKSMIKLLHNFKGLVHPIIGNGRSIYFWEDQWNQNIPRQQYPELFSFAKSTKLSIAEVKEHDHLSGIFQLPISEQAYEQYLELQVVWEQIILSTVQDRWRYIWGSDSYSTQKAYRHLMGQTQVHHIYKHLWKSKCQPKHRVFYWLWLKNRLNTRHMLRRKNMTLESYSCENCLWQREETLYHLFLRCNFAKACWNSIGITP
jgi:hypothetical protein